MAESLARLKVRAGFRGSRVYEFTTTVRSRKLENGCRMISADSPSFVGLGLEDGPVATVGLYCNPGAPKSPN